MHQPYKTIDLLRIRLETHQRFSETALDVGDLEEAIAEEFALETGPEMTRMINTCRGLVTE